MAAPPPKDTAVGTVVSLGGGTAGDFDVALDVWFQGDKSHLEFRGRPYTEWEGDAADDWFQRAHDCLEGMHSSVLHTDSVLAILPRHPDYDRIVALMAEAQA